MYFLKNLVKSDAHPNGLNCRARDGDRMLCQLDEVLEEHDPDDELGPRAEGDVGVPGWSDAVVAGDPRVLTPHALRTSRDYHTKQSGTPKP